MRFLVLSLSLLSLSAFGAVNSAEIKEAAEEIGHLTQGFTATKVKGRNVEEMVRNLAEKHGFEHANFTYKPSGRMPGPDEEYGEYGLTTKEDLVSAIGKEIRRDQAGNEREISKALGLLAKWFDAAEQAGAIFGYNSEKGGTACGSVWPAPMLIDEEEKVIYEIQLASGPC